MPTFTRNNAQGQSLNFEADLGADGNFREELVVAAIVGGNATPASSANPLPVADTASELALGTTADAPWFVGGGLGSIVAILKGAVTLLTGALLVRSAGSTGTDYSANAAAIPGTFLLGTAPVNPNRNAITVQNQSQFAVQIVRDNGSGANVTSFFLAPAVTAPPGAGGFWSSATFKGRVRTYCAASATAPVAMCED